MSLETQTGLRLTHELRERIEAHRREMAAKSPGVSIGFADAMRNLIERGLLTDTSANVVEAG